MTSPPGTRVVLYACTTSQGDPERILLELRQHARAHGWDIVAEFYDITGAAPIKARSGFLQAQAHITAARAGGIVTRYRAMAAYFPSEQADLAEWLDKWGAFAHYTWQSPRHRHPLPVDEIPAAPIEAEL